MIHVIAPQNDETRKPGAARLRVREALGALNDADVKLLFQFCDSSNEPIVNG